ncbi:conserved hypothetical protein [Trichinella spiralis]|uniref:hypothetical protein n=1 Tax=Trichinella spiralis TaxID=6334 RepID=UPI0001EFEDDA|nr:conserved hypothetical protein [Trichinella spiralis]
MKRDLQRWMYNLRIDATVDVVELDESKVNEQAYERTQQMREHQNRPGLKDFSCWNIDTKNNDVANNLPKPEKLENAPRPIKQSISEQHLSTDTEDVKAHHPLASFIRKLSVKGQRAEHLQMTQAAGMPLSHIGYDNPNFEFCDKTTLMTRKRKQIFECLTFSSRQNG